MKTLFLAALLAVSLSAEAKTLEIKMVNNGKSGIMAFEPAYLKAEPGDTVKFVPTDASHNSTSVLVPAGAKGWQGKTSKEVSVTLKKEGVYLFKCDPHVSMAMVGVVQVGKPTNLDAAKTEATKLAAGFMMNKDRLQKIMDQVK